MSEITLNDITGPGPEELQGQLGSLVKGLEGRTGLTSEIIAEHILQQISDVQELSGTENYILPFPVKQPIVVDFEDDSTVRITNVGGFGPIFYGKQTPQWIGKSAGYLVTHGFPPKVTQFAAINRFKFGLLGVPPSGSLIMVFDLGIQGKSSRYGVYVGSALLPHYDHPTQYATARGAGHFFRLPPHIVQL